MSRPPGKDVREVAAEDGLSVMKKKLFAIEARSMETCARDYEIRDTMHGYGAASQPLKRTAKGTVLTAVTAVSAVARKGSRCMLRKFKKV